MEKHKSLQISSSFQNPKGFHSYSSSPFNPLYRVHSMEGGILNSCTENLLSKHPMRRQGPSLSAIDSFLVGNQSNNLSLKLQAADQNQINLSFNEEDIYPDGACYLSSKNGLVNSLSTNNRVSWTTSFLQQEAGLGSDSDFFGWTLERNPSMVFKDEVKNSKGGKRSKKVSSSSLIKGQWTDEEDRKLKTLVKQYGVRKWAQIAEKMGARAGKQCRERWNNHLRPNIKKDSWTEEEERILVEAHVELGNKWSEIAKRIAGRTENTIKNHWNATKRRQNSRRKHKQAGKGGNGKKPQPSILQDYIKSNNLNSTTSPPSVKKATPTSLSPSSSIYSEDNHTSQITNFLAPQETSESNLEYLHDVVDSPPSLIANNHDEELLFMQTFFADNACMQNTLDVDFNAETMKLVQPMHVDIQEQETPPPPPPKSTKTTTSHLSCDLYISHLLNGTDPASSISSSDSLDMMSCDHNMDVVNLLADDHQAYSSDQRRDMDLIEMVSASMSQGNISYY